VAVLCPEKLEPLPKTGPRKNNKQMKEKRQQLKSYKHARERDKEAAKE